MRKPSLAVTTTEADGTLMSDELSALKRVEASRILIRRAMDSYVLQSQSELAQRTGFGLLKNLLARLSEIPSGLLATVDIIRGVRRTRL